MYFGTRGSEIPFWAPSGTSWMSLIFNIFKLNIFICKMQMITGFTRWGCYNY